MEKYLLAFLCSQGYDAATRSKCQDIIKQTVREFQIYQTIKEKEREYREFAEYKLTKPVFWAITTTISSASTQRLLLTGHNVLGIDSVNLRLGKSSEISLTWSF